jgi:hypothetical protein
MGTQTPARRGNYPLARCFIALSAAVALVSCASRSGAEAGGSVGTIVPTLTPPLDVPGVNWDNPANGIPAGSLASVSPSLAFTPTVPTGLGEQMQLFTGPPALPKDGQFVEFIYDSPAYGRVIVVEHPPDLPPSEWTKSNEALVQSAPKDTAEILTTNSGTEVFIFSRADGTRAGVYLMSGGAEIWIAGPNLTVDQAAAIAGQF